MQNDALRDVHKFHPPCRNQHVPPLITNTFISRCNETLVFFCLDAKIIFIVYERNGFSQCHSHKYLNLRNIFFY